MANTELYIKYIRLITSPFVKAFFYAALFLIFIGDIVIDCVTFVLKTVVNTLLFVPRQTKYIPYKFKYFALGIALTLLVFFVYQSYIFVKTLPTPKLIGTVNYSVSTKILDRHGSLLYEIFHDQNRTPVKLTSLPKYVSQATIAVEDQDFYHHPGISFYGGILRATKEMLFDRGVQGGSTITQQLVKSALLTPERTITRKIKEAILAIWTERMYTKEQILEMYLNQVPYGGSSYGIEEASRTFFGKSSHDLTISQAAFLAGLPQAPSLYSPYTNPKYALARRNDVLKKMYEQKFINKNQHQQASRELLTVKPQTQYIKAPHFVFYVKSVLEKMYGIARVEAGGLRVVTSLDLKTQEQSEKILNEEVEKIHYLNVTNGAALVTAPQSGEILAMVGSADYYRTPDGAFNVTTALRQPGSSIKPLMYSLALEKGYTAATQISDAPITFRTAGSQPYQPVNYDGRFHGNVSLRTALASSYNIPAVKVLNTLGVNQFIDHASAMGISTWEEKDRFGLSLTLGGGEVTMTDMATAYGVFATGGNRVPVNPLLSVTDYNGNSLYQKNNNEGTLGVISKAVAFIISDILSDTAARTPAFGTNSKLEIPGYKVAVKTGTTNDKRDNWTVGYTPSYLTAVWVGNNDNSPMHPALTSGVTGAAPIFNRIMTTILNANTLKLSTVKSGFMIPEGVVSKPCLAKKPEYFVKGTENKVTCALTKVSPTPQK